MVSAASLLAQPSSLHPCHQYRDRDLISACINQVCEHHKRGFDSARLSETFGFQTLGNGLVAGRLSLQMRHNG
jgi:hypothetical protein